MHLASPLALVLLLLLPLIFLARTTQPQERRRVSHLAFWKEAAATGVLSPARRLRRDWLLLLQAAFIAAVVVALARPFVVSGHTVAVVIDVSMSMSARREGVSRLDSARAAALDRIGTLPGRTQVHVIAADAVPSFSGTFRADAPALSGALDVLKTTASREDLDEAIVHATRLDPAPDRIYVLTDTPLDATAARTDVEWITVGAPSDNAAVTLVTTRPAASGSSAVQALVRVSNYGSTRVRGDVVMTREGAELWRETVDIASGAHTTLVRAVQAGTGIVTVTLEHDDAVALDNVRSAVMASSARMRVEHIGRSGFLARALESHAGIEMMTDSASGSTAAAGRTADVLICDGCENVPPGDANVLLVPPRRTPAIGGAGAPADGHPVALIPTGRLSPFAVEFDGRVVPILVDRPADDVGVVARAGGLPVIVAHEEEARRIVELRFDPDTSPFSRSVGFPVVVAMALDWLSPWSRNARTITAGDLFQWALPGRTSVSIVGPDSQPVGFTFSDARLLARPSLAGVYHVRDGAADQRFVVNPDTGRESNLAATRTTTDRGQSAVVEAAPFRTEATGWVVGAALLLLAGEWWYQRRRVTAREAIPR
jgi:hypothetical protein